MSRYPHVYGQHWTIHKSTDTVSPSKGGDQKSEHLRMQEQSSTVSLSKGGDQKRVDHKSISSTK